MRGFQQRRFVASMEAGAEEARLRFAQHSHFTPASASTTMIVIVTMADEACQSICQSIWQPNATTLGFAFRESFSAPISAMLTRAAPTSNIKRKNEKTNDKRQHSHFTFLPHIPAQAKQEKKGSYPSHTKHRGECGTVSSRVSGCLSRPIRRYISVCSDTAIGPFEHVA